MDNYTILIHPKTVQKVRAYWNAISTQSRSAGVYLQQILDRENLSHVDIETFIEYLFRTKQPQIFAESDVAGDGSDWTPAELSILGDISVAAPVQVFDDGLHINPNIHECPFPATLLYTPGALLCNGMDTVPADWYEVVRNNQIDSVALFKLYERRLLPPLLYASQVSQANQSYALITIPGIGCGQFAGEFRGQLGLHIQSVLVNLLKHYIRTLPNIKAIYYDPYNECLDRRFNIGDISLFVRPLLHTRTPKPQLCQPQSYAEGDDFSDCQLFSLVAWDPVSWPGNDFFVGERATDDGVKSAATSSMSVITGIKGTYDRSSHTFSPPASYQCWQEVVERNALHLRVTI